MTHVIQTSGLTRRYGSVTALNDVSVSIEKDAITGLLGRNGAGKTVLMSLIAAQDNATAGTVLIDGVNPAQHEGVLRGISFIRDHQRYPSDYRVRELLRIAPVFHPAWSSELASTVIETLDIPVNRSINKLSRGQLSAVAVLVGLASRAPITMFDEPYLGLDATARLQFYDLLLADYSAHPRTIIVSTHLIDEMEPLLQNIIVLDRGRVRRLAPAEELRSAAIHLSGRREAIEAVLGTSAALTSSWLGSVGAVLVENQPDLATRARHAGLDIRHATLQELVAAYGLADITRSAA